MNSIIDRKKLVSSAEFILTNKCNLNCKYCYSFESREISTISKEFINEVIAYLFQNAVIKKELGLKSDVHISFIGGGEPTLAWNELVCCVETIKNISLLNKCNYTLSITTNGILSIEKINYLITNNFNIKVSLDGIDQINNLTRVDVSGEGIYENVSRILDLLNLKNANFKIGAVVCNLNYKYMEEFVKRSIERWPNIENICFSYLQNTTSSKTNNIEQINYIKFLKKVDKCNKILFKNNIGIFKKYNSIKDYYYKNIYKCCPKEKGEKLVVNCDNEVYCCTQFINERTIYVNYMNEKYNMKNDLKSLKCENCKFVHYCMVYNDNCMKIKDILNNKKIKNKYCRYIKKKYRYVL